MTELTRFVPTTQKALLEKPLTWLRTRKVLPWINGKTVLDFGCGQHYSTLTSIQHLIRQGIGYDIVFRGQSAFDVAENLAIVGDLQDIAVEVDVVIALACFEHLEKETFLGVLSRLRSHLQADGMIVGTMPTPKSRPVLEFLSYKLGLIDKSQILDHKIYYDFHLLKETVEEIGWVVEQYRTFQFGMNSFFVLRPLRRSKDGNPK
jgi:cyclopropane fatty-acyl-phospholipid synthase-like methyltransferase